VFIYQTQTFHLFVSSVKTYTPTQLYITIYSFTFSLIIAVHKVCPGHFITKATKNITTSVVRIHEFVLAPREPLEKTQSTLYGAVTLVTKLTEDSIKSVQYRLIRLIVQNLLESF